MIYIQSTQQHAYSKSGGKDWKCDKGYYHDGNECRPVVVPKNASLDSYGHGWECDHGYKNVNNICIPMTRGELKRQKEMEQTKLTERRRRRHEGGSEPKGASELQGSSEPQGVSESQSASELQGSSEPQDASELQAVSRSGCAIEYKTNAEVCIDSISKDIRCHQRNLENYYSDCDVTLSYAVETNYQGGSYLDVDVTCTLEIEYEGRKFYDTRTDSRSENQSHSLFANGTDGETMYFKFSLETYLEITKVKIRSAECVIEHVGLY